MDTILTLDEVAAYLKVTERTVTDWVNAGEFPGGKIGNSWRFRKGDVVEWVNRQLTPHKHYGASSSVQSIKAILNPSKIIFTEFKTKNEVLNALIDQCMDIPGIGSRTQLSDAVFKREELMSTGIGMSIAVPHVRLNGVDAVSAALCINREVIEDYESLDDEPVKIIVLFVAGRSQHTEYIQSLGLFSDRLKLPLIRQQIIEASDAASVYSILTE